MDYGSSDVNKNRPIPPVMTFFFASVSQQRKEETGKKVEEE